MSAEVETLPIEEAPAAAGSSFYAAMRMLPREQREAMYHVYAFCRAVDDVADNSGARDTRLADLALYRTDIEDLYVTGKRTQRTRDLADPIARYGLL
ncbi:MAG: squalene/phytoene synthase family protein, partial [Hyphomicrobium sp.]